MSSIFVRRAALGITQAALGLRAGFAQSEVSRAERGIASASVVDRVCEMLADLERKRGIRPPRDHRLQQRRLALGLSISDLSERAFFRVGCERRLTKVEAGIGDPADVAVVRRALVFEESEPRRRREDLRRERARIARQRMLWDALPLSPEKAALERAMLDRCFDLMCAHNGSETDAIAEWLPEERVGEMFEQWERFQEGTAPEMPGIAPVIPGAVCSTAIGEDHEEIPESNR